MPYSKGAISIPNVTGNIVITVATQAVGPAWTNLIPTAIPYNDQYTNGYHKDYRCNSSGTETSTSGCVCSGYIHVTVGDMLRYGYIGSTAAASNTGWYVCRYDSSKNHIGTTSGTSGGTMANGLLTIDTTGWASNTAYIRVSAIYGVGNTFDASKFVCTLNEPIE